MMVKEYQPSDKAEWDKFVRSSRNGTFLLLRDFMDYHVDRFEDASVMCYDAKGKLIALFPCNQEVSTMTIFSHAGLTYGGLIVAESTRTQAVVEIYEAIIKHFQSQGWTSIRVKPIPHIYHQQPSEEELYALHTLRARLISRAISSAIDLTQPGLVSTLRKRQARKAALAGVKVSRNIPLPSFWTVLTDNLLARHQVAPVHSLKEIELLAERFRENIISYGSYSQQGELLAGVIAFVAHPTLHLQYIAASPAGKTAGALDALILQIIADATDANFGLNKLQYIDFGISTENKGTVLNAGLISQKEGFGARGIVYDEYQIDFQ